MLNLVIKSIKLSLCIAVILTGVICVNGVANAGGKMVIKPVMAVLYGHESNYFRADKDESSVNTYSISPGFELGWYTAKSLATLNYSISGNEYSKVDSVDDPDYIGHRLDFKAQTQLSPRIGLGFENAFMKTRESGQTDIYDNNIERYKYSINRFSPKMSYGINDKIQLNLKYSNIWVDYSKSAQEDSTQNKGHADVTYSFAKDTSLALDYDVWVHDYDKTTSDYVSNQYGLQLEKKFSWLTLGAGAGYHNRSFDKSGLKDNDTMTWNFSMEGQTDSSKTRMNLDLSQNFNDFGVGEEYYEATRLEAELGRLFMDKIDVLLKSTYEKSDYENSSRDDDTWTIASQVSYEINDMVSFSAEPGFELRDSSEDGRDYENKYIVLQVNLTYDPASK